MSACLICERVALASEGRSPYLIAEMDHSYFVVGDHQWHRGYALVLLKEHVREAFELSPDAQREHFREVMRAAEAVNSTFHRRKMNFRVTATRSHTCTGTLFPDTRTIRTPAKPPWGDRARFGEKTISADQARQIAAKIRHNFE